MSRRAVDVSATARPTDDEPPLHVHKVERVKGKLRCVRCGRKLDTWLLTHPCGAEGVPQ